MRKIQIPAAKGYTVEEISEKEVEETEKKRSSSYRDRSRSLKRTGTPDIGMSFRLKG
jgi:hypothetical protein